MKFPPVGADVYRIGHGNVYVGNKKPAAAVTIARQTLSTSFGFNEATRIAPRLAALKMWRDFGADPGFSDMSDALDCITIVQNRMRMYMHSYQEVTKDVEPSKLGHQRGITTVGYAKKGLPKIAHINIHPNPINFLDPNNKGLLVLEYIKNMEALVQTLNLVRRTGYLPVVTGDFNITQAKARKLPYSNPYHIATSFNLNAVGYGVDGILWDKSLRVVRKQTIPETATGSDHLWFFFDFKVA